jgi:two-component system, chemotaxis family, chemotaxis protein CheY
MPAPHVLVVDDHQLYRQTFCSLLRGCFPQLDIVTASDGSAALSLTMRTRFALVVLDYQLPSLTGGDVVRHLRARSRVGDILPAIVLTSSQPDVPRFARMLSVDGFLPKPITADEIEAVVGPLLARPRHEASVHGPKLWRIRPAT